jgi:hypothetical protein
MLRLFPSTLDVTHGAIADAAAVVCPTACRPRRAAHHPQARRQPSRARRLDPARPHRGPQLGRPARRRDRHRAGVPPQDRAAVAAPLQRPRRGRTRRPAPIGPATPAGRDRARAAHRPGPPGSTWSAGQAGRRGPCRPKRAAAGPVDPGRRGPGRPRAGHRRRPQPGPPHPAGRGGALAASALVDQQQRPGVRPK